VRRALLVSLLLHALAIALLLTIRAPEQALAHFARVTPIASPYRAPMPMKSPPHVQPFHSPRTAARTFRVPDRLPQSAQPRLAPVIPDPPVIRPPDVRSPDIRPPESASPFLELPPPPVRRIVATGAFDGTTPPNPVVTHTEVTTGHFGDASTAAATSRKAPDAAISSAAEILSKPRPAYTDEARRLRIEGEVLLEVLFAASGEVRVLRTIRGLGHGLDENAIAAARAIQFRPAQRGDAAVDSNAVVHIVFQLAY
jgi:TonB family protein